MIMKVRYGAGEHERFAPTAFDAQVGKEIRVNLPGGSRMGTVTAAEVAAGGRSATVTIEVNSDDMDAHLAEEGLLELVECHGLESMSFGFVEAHEDTSRHPGQPPR